MISLDHIQKLYDSHRFMDAFEQSAEYWKPSTRLDSLSVRELVLGGRLAARLGGWRLARHLLRMAFERCPSDSLVRYYVRNVQRRKSSMLDDLRNFEADLQSCDDHPEIKPVLLAWQALTWAYLRNFTQAHKCIERAHALESAKDGWITACEADVLGFEDRWNDSLEAARRAWELSPRAAFAAQPLTTSLLNLGRVQESSQWLAQQVEGSQSYELFQLASWHQCALAETLEGEERRQSLERARTFAERMASLMPLADRESLDFLACVRLDIAALADNHEEMEKWAKETHYPFFRRVVENIRKRPGGRRTRLPYRRCVQKYEACLPTALASALSALNEQLDPSVMASEITFGGTAEWAAAEWLEKRGFAVRFFSVNPEVAGKLIEQGIAFVVTLVSDESAHAVAVVGMDEAAGTFLIHDPSVFRTSEYLAESFAQDLEPWGLKGMVAVPAAMAARLDELLSADGVALMTAVHEHTKALTLHGSSAAREVVNRIAERLPSHPGVGLMQALQAIEDGHMGEALQQFQELLAKFPHSGLVRSRLVSACRALGNTALSRQTLANVVERGVLPGMSSQQTWLHPPARYVAEYADCLRFSDSTLQRAKSLLHAAIRRTPASSDAWHVLADLLWKERDVEGQLIAYCLASCQDLDNEHYARAYCDALCAERREEEGFAWLEQRARRFGAQSRGASTWATWVGALEDWGHPDRALAVASEALQQRGEADELLAFLVPFLARMGRWEQAEELLQRLEKSRNTPLFYQAALAFHRLRGNLVKSVEHAEALVREAPGDNEARRVLLELIAKRDGPNAAIALGARWVAERPGHDEIEGFYCEQLSRPSGSPRKKYELLLHRVKRNPEDAWAWIELAFLAIGNYEESDERQRARCAARVTRFLTECDRTARESATTFRAHGRWHEARGEWHEAIADYLQSIDREPANSYGYYRAWECAANFSAEERRGLWEKLEPTLLRPAGRLTLAGDMARMLAQRFGVAFAEEAVSRWNELRPDDPEVNAALAELLLDFGQGRTDAARALALLQPAVERFPFHVGIRFLLGSAYERLGNFAAANDVRREIVRRHPDNSIAWMRLSSTCERDGKIDEARELLERTAANDPHNMQLHEALVQWMIRRGRIDEAREKILEVLRRSPESIHWRERAIELLLNCGDEPAAVAAAREGIRVYPDGAYLWYLLATTLHRLPRLSEPGEIEFCFRRSLALNPGLFITADYLAILLTRQRRYAEAEEVIRRILPQMGDSSPARGRLAVVHREQGKKDEAREELAQTVRDAPWFLWGWSVLIGWLAEDRAWKQAISLLNVVPPEVSTNAKFRQERLSMLEQAGLPAGDLEDEWKRLLHDFPEEIPVHLLRYDALREARRLPEARAVLHAIQAVEPDNPWLLARYVEVLVEEEKSAEALDALERLFCAPAESSAWPADYAWSAIERAALPQQAYTKLRATLERSAQITPRAFFILCARALTQGKTEKKTKQPAWRTWFPDRGARELLRLLEVAERAPWMQGIYRAQAFDQLSKAGYYGMVVRYWKRNKMKVEADVASWAETARALACLGRHTAVRKLLANWRNRTGVGMWVVTNFVQSFSLLRPAHLREIAGACRDALASLPHDHCARFLAHARAQACALLGDEHDFLDTWTKFRSYFGGKKEENEWFSNSRAHLLTDVPELASLLEQDRNVRVWLRVWSWRWNEFWKFLFGKGEGSIF